MSFPIGCTPLRRLKIRKIAIAKIRDIDQSTYREVVTNVGNWNFNILPASAWVELPLKQEAEYQLASRKTAHGTRYIHVCNGELTPNDAETTFTMVEYREEDMLVRITDHLGTEYLMGTFEQEVRLTFSKRLGDSSGHSFELGCEGRHPLYGYAPVVNV